MKKIYYLMLAMLMAMTTLGLTACGDDEEDGPNGGGGDIVGTWKCNMLDYKDEIDKLFTRFELLDKKRNHIRDGRHECS